VLDVLPSDYVPASLLMAALILPQAAPTIELPAALPSHSPSWRILRRRL